MSFARFSDSDIYAFPTNDGYECMSCPLMPKRHLDERTIGSVVLPAGAYSTSFKTASVEHYLLHIGHHRQAGHDLPDDIEAEIAKWEAHWRDRR